MQAIATAALSARCFAIAHALICRGSLCLCVAAQSHVEPFRCFVLLIRTLPQPFLVLLGHAAPLPCVAV